jgi:hypothetical protein
MAAQKSSIYEITDLALEITKKYISKVPETIVDVKEKKDEWVVTVEVLERKAVPDTQDLLGRYEIRINKSGQLIGWTQKIIRIRSDRIAASETETANSSS